MKIEIQEIKIIVLKQWDQIVYTVVLSGGPTGPTGCEFHTLYSSVVNPDLELFP